MSVQNISIYSNGFGNFANNGEKPSFLGIGKKGQLVKGTVTQVGDTVTLNFNGIEVAVAKTAVKSAKVGEIRDFEIMNVSKDSIVLREVGEAGASQPVRGMVSTTVNPSDYSFTECLEASKDAAAAGQKASESLTVLTGADYEAVESEEGSLEKRTKECVERATQKRKERIEWTKEKLEEGAEFRKELSEEMKKLQANGFLSQKSEGQLRQALLESGIPATDAILEKVVNALRMSQSAIEVNDSSKAYIIEENLSPTLGNLYQGKYLSAQDVAGSSLQNFAEYSEQIERILQECGKADEEGMQNAKWLFEHELPINEETVSKLEMLNYIPENMTPDKVLEQILFAMREGLSPDEAVMDDSLFVAARDVVQGFQEIDDFVIHRTVEKQRTRQQTEAARTDGMLSGNDAGKSMLINLELLRQIKEETFSGQNQKSEIPVVYTADLSETDIIKVTLKRQLEEIRQKMTVQSAVAMQQRGIHIETESLDKIIKSLRELENAYYAQVSGDGEELQPQQLDLLQETLEKTADIANAHAAILGTGVRQQQLLTMNELHAAVTSQTAGRNDWNQVFEKVSTQVRADLGDSIQKAFEGVPKLLEDMQIEPTETNIRAARILGYNGMEITEESLEQVKVFDAEVNRVVDNMKPVIVLELIKKGENPLDIPLSQLNFELEQIQDEKGISSEERYSRFLWQMEKEGQISEEERKGYIGVYRLLNQLQKNDGAAIGALIGTGQELTLGNLLTQVRTKKSKGIDAGIDGTSGVYVAGTMKNSITNQINEGFSQAENTKQLRQTEYYRHLAGEALAGLTPSGLEEMTDGDMQRLLNTSLEQFCEKLKQVPGNPEIKKAYFEEQAETIREKLASGGAAEEYLSKLQVENTIGNILAAEAVLEEGYVPWKEAYERKKVLSEEKQEKFAEVIDGMAEAAGEEELSGQCEKAEKIMQEILTKSYQQADISFEDLSKLKLLGQGIRLEGALRQSKSYDIPIQTGDGITSLNLTLIHGVEESGRIQISMENETFGNIAVDVKVSGSSLKGLVLCDRRQGFEALQSQNEALTAELETAGYQVKNISYGMDFKSRNELLSDVAQGQKAETAGLYQIAKFFVRSITTVIKE